MKEFGFESIIAKRRASCCESGKRSGRLAQYKVNKAQAFVNWRIIRQTIRSMLMFASTIRNGFCRSVAVKCGRSLSICRLMLAHFAIAGEEADTVGAHARAGAAVRVA